MLTHSDYNDVLHDTEDLYDEYNPHGVLLTHIYDLALAELRLAYQHAQRYEDAIERLGEYQDIMAAFDANMDTVIMQLVAI